METEYGISIGYKIFYGLLGAVSIVAALAFFNVICNGDNPKFAYLFPLIMLAGGILIFVNLFKRKVVITADSITYTYVFKTVTITFDHIKGFRFGDKVKEQRLFIYIYRLAFPGCCACYTRRCRYRDFKLPKCLGSVYNYWLSDADSLVFCGDKKI